MWDVRKIAPYEYRLSQAADMVCTLELMREKSENGAGMSKSEFIFFESRRRLSKVFLKTLKRTGVSQELAHRVTEPLVTLPPQPQPERASSQTST